MNFSTPLRYPGGKGRLASYVAEILNLNDINDGCYAEPFCGGAGIAISLLFGERVERIFLNDVDRSVFAFWHSVVSENDKLCSLIEDTPVNMDVWYEQREIQMQKEEEELLKLAFSTFFLNRTNRSGILTAGVIGGKEQKGKWKIDARFKKGPLLERIRRIGEFSKRISVSNEDVISFIDNIVPTFPLNTFIYFDPPYFNKGQQLYRNHFIGEDHANLAAKIQKDVEQPWIVSYDNVDEITELYEDRDQETFSLNYSANQHYEGSELMVFKDGLIAPEAVYASRRLVA
jgi:DNA adenine methylase